MTKAEEALRNHTILGLGPYEIKRLKEEFFAGYKQAQQDTIESACQILYDWNKQVTEMFGAKAVLSCNQFTIDVDRFRKLLELEKL